MFESSAMNRVKSPKTSRSENLLTPPGTCLITGAADDDPSGVRTYSQVGAQFGFEMLWIALFSFPLMAAIQEICGRLGRITVERHSES
jgi:Mn2+/Fe2+ NRAMP family transporter